MQLNKKSIGPKTYEGGAAIKFTPYQALERAVLSCLLWENQFYEDGESIATRIEDFAMQCQVDDVAQLAMKAKYDYKLRHIPLLLTVMLLKRRASVVQTFNPKFKMKIPIPLWQFISLYMIRRVDDLMELIALYWKDGKKPLAAQLKKGLSVAFNKFDEYQFAKYNRDKAIKLRDVMFMVHPKAIDEEQAAVFKRIANDELKTPDTWEVALSGGADKGETFERLIDEGKLGYLALLRNLRNIAEYSNNVSLLKKATAMLVNNPGHKNILPFQFIAAAKAATQFEHPIDIAMRSSLQNMPRLLGETIILVDVSGSMNAPLSAKSQLTRLDAACGIAILSRGICESVNVFTFSEKLIGVPARQGMALRDAIFHSQPRSSTYLGEALQIINQQFIYDRLIVITDEQSHDSVGAPQGKGYMINVGSYQNGVGFGKWVRINGFSEAVIRFIQEYEAMNNE